MPGSFSSVALQDRDLVLLRDLFESRIMTGAHAAELHFEGRKEAAKKRLQKLKAARLIGERPRRAYEPAVLHLTSSALELLDERGILAEYPPFSFTSLRARARVSDATIRHELEVMDVKAALVAALRKNSAYRLIEFGTWPRLNEFKVAPAGGPEVVIRPDGFIRIHENEPDGGTSEHAFFLEVDRSTEVQDSLVGKAMAYLEYYKSGGFAVRNGATRSAFSEYPFRVLVVCKSAERRNNLAERLYVHHIPILTQVWLTTTDEARTNYLGKIWIRPLDYREVLKGSPHEAERRAAPVYRREIARDKLVEEKIVKLALFEV